MKFIENKRINQRKKEHPRRVFADTNHFDLYVWYDNSQFENIIGFQLIYRANPFNTDDEYFFTLKPQLEEEKAQTGKTGAKVNSYAAPKVIVKTETDPPLSFRKDWEVIKSTLPEDIESFVQERLPH